MTTPPTYERTRYEIVKVVRKSKGIKSTEPTVTEETRESITTEKPSLSSGGTVLEKIEKIHSNKKGTSFKHTITQNGKTHQVVTETDSHGKVRRTTSSTSDSIPEGLNVIDTTILSNHHTSHPRNSNHGKEAPDVPESTTNNMPSRHTQGESNRKTTSSLQQQLKNILIRMEARAAEQDSTTTDDSSNSGLLGIQSKPTGTLWKHSDNADKPASSQVINVVAIPISANPRDVVEVTPTAEADTETESFETTHSSHSTNSPITNENTDALRIPVTAHPYTETRTYIPRPSPAAFTNLHHRFPRKHYTGAGTYTTKELDPNGSVLIEYCDHSQCTHPQRSEYYTNRGLEVPTTDHGGTSIYRDRPTVYHSVTVEDPWIKRLFDPRRHNRHVKSKIIRDHVHPTGVHYHKVYRHDNHTFARDPIPRFQNYKVPGRITLNSKLHQRSYRPSQSGYNSSNVKSNGINLQSTNHASVRTATWLKGHANLPNQSDSEDARTSLLVHASSVVDQERTTETTHARRSRESTGSSNSGQNQPEVCSKISQSQVKRQPCSLSHISGFGPDAGIGIKNLLNGFDRSRGQTAATERGPHRSTEGLNDDVLDRVVHQVLKGFVKNYLEHDSNSGNSGTRHGTPGLTIEQSGTFGPSGTSRSNHRLDARRPDTHWQTHHETTGLSSDYYGTDQATGLSRTHHQTSGLHTELSGLRHRRGCSAGRSTTYYCPGHQQTQLSYPDPYHGAYNPTTHLSGTCPQSQEFETGQSGTHLANVPYPETHDYDSSANATRDSTWRNSSDRHQNTETDHHELTLTIPPSVSRKQAQNSNETTDVYYTARESPTNHHSTASYSGNHRTTESHHTRHSDPRNAHHTRHSDPRKPHHARHSDPRNAQPARQFDLHELHHARHPSPRDPHHSTRHSNSKRTPATVWTYTSSPPPEDERPFFHLFQHSFVSFTPPTASSDTALFGERHVHAIPKKDLKDLSPPHRKPIRFCDHLPVRTHSRSAD